MVLLRMVVVACFVCAQSGPDACIMGAGMPVQFDVSVHILVVCFFHPLVACRFLIETSNLKKRKTNKRPMSVRRRLHVD
jgi:hypothetical protein